MEDDIGITVTFGRSMADRLATLLEENPAVLIPIELEPFGRIGYFRVDKDGTVTCLGN